MFLIIVDITFIILLAISIFGFCATRSPRESSKKEREISEKSSPRNSSPSRRKRARPLEPEDFIPPAEGSVKNPDVGEMIDERSKKSQKSMERSQKMKGFVLEKDRSVRRLEDKSKYEAKTSARYRRTAATDMNGSLKSVKSPKKTKKSAKEKSKSKKSEKSKSKSSKKEKKSEKAKVKLETKQSERKLEVEELESKKEAGEQADPKPTKFKKIRKPWKNLFKLKRKRQRNDVNVTEREGTWA